MELIGFYNSLRYQIIDGKGNEVYSAGNSPYDSQTYTTSENGVGLETMKNYCEQTIQELAEEKHAKIIGIQFLDEED